jgi:hypothetical protein
VLGWAALREPRFIIISTPQLCYFKEISGMINKSGLDAVAPSYIIKKNNDFTLIETVGKREKMFSISFQDCKIFENSCNIFHKKKLVQD